MANRDAQNQKAALAPRHHIGDHEEVDFAPTDLTDGREEKNWRSRYQERWCRFQICAEALYLLVLLYGSAFLLLLVWLETPQSWLDVSDDQYATFQVYAYAWLGGLLGGTLFAVKWLYHTVGKGIWNADRLPWRIFIPHLSSAFSFGLIAIITSSIFPVLNQELVRQGAAVVGLSLILGYFSDFTVARLYRLAENLLGTPTSHRKPAD
ncbi:MAG TPA: hypothetical protein VKB23_11685 [Solirubrobacterales bacterium]|nr:hypothetical protein [Solirubrobacterales bacterium]